MAEETMAPTAAGGVSGSDPDEAPRGPEAKARAQRVRERADRRAHASGEGPAAQPSPAARPAARRPPAERGTLRPPVLIGAVVVAALVGALLAAASLPGWLAGLVVGLVSVAIVATLGRQPA
jgi:hypothetical protein